jgi:hypothetical protein
MSFYLPITIVIIYHFMRLKYLFKNQNRPREGKYFPLTNIAKKDMIIDQYAKHRIAAKGFLSDVSIPEKTQWSPVYHMESLALSSCTGRSYEDISYFSLPAE